MQLSKAIESPKPAFPAGTQGYSKRELFRAKLEHLEKTPRRLLKWVLFFFGHLITVENKRALDGIEDPVIFAFNHNSSYETMLVPASIMYHRNGKKISFVIDWVYGRLPVIGWMFNQSDPVYVYNKPARYKWLDRVLRPRRYRNGTGETIYGQCREYLEAGKSIGIFPEGTRNRNPRQLKRGRSGIGMMALENGVPVLPVGIDFPVRMKKGKIPRLGRMVLRIGEPLMFLEEKQLWETLQTLRDIPAPDRRRIENYLRARVTDKVMIRLSELCGKSYDFPPPDKPECWDSFIKEKIKEGGESCHE